MRERMTLIGLENQLNYDNKSIVDSWSLSTIDYFDPQVLLSDIIVKGGTFEPLYSDPEFFYYMCSFFWQKWERTFTKWFEAFEIEYNPLENYDRHESWTESKDDTGTVDSTDTRTNLTSEVTDTDTTDNTTITNSETTDNDTTTENKVSAYDSSGYSEKDKSITENDISVSGTTLNSSTGTVDTSFRSTNNDSTVIDTDTTNKSEIEHEGHLHGNIGVTTSQEMLKSELDIQSWNIYEHMTDIFIKEMLITVY